MTNFKIANTALLFLSAIFIIISCKKAEFKTAQKDQSENQKTAEKKTVSLKKIKDTVLFVGSTEGKDIKLFINTQTQDSILESEVMGETGMARYKFTFNKKLKTGECITLRYAKPIYINPNPKIVSEEKENMQSSKESKERLTSVFESDLQLIGNNK